MTPKETSTESVVDTVRRVQAGEPAAFADLVRRFQDFAVGYAWSHLKDHHLEEEVAQDAFIQVLGDLKDLHEPAAFPGCLRRIVHKHSDRRTRRAQLPTVTLDGLEEFVAHQGLSAQTATERKEQADFVHEAIAALPDHRREHGWRNPARRQAVTRRPL